MSHADSSDDKPSAASARTMEPDIDWGDDADEVVVASCDLSNPEICESCT